MEIILIKTDNNGDTLWTRTFHNENIIKAINVKQTADNGYLVYAEVRGGMWLIRTNETGDTIWSKVIPGSDYDEQGWMIINSEGDYILTGSMFIEPSNINDLFLMKMSGEISDIADQEKIDIVTFLNLSTNYPNPFNPTTTIQFDLPRTSEVTLKVFNILGEEVATLVSDRLSAGSYSYEWNASNIASGVYLCRLETKGYVETKKMILMR